MNNDVKKNENKNDFREYEYYKCPVILLDTGFKIIYKNNAAKSSDMKLRAGTAMRKHINSANIKILRRAIENGEFKILELDGLYPVKRCIFLPSDKSVIILAFFDILNFLSRDSTDDDKVIGKLENLMAEYNKKIKIETQNGVVAPDFNKNKKITKIREYFVNHISNSSVTGKENHKTYCDVGLFLKNFAVGIFPYTNSLGYKIKFNIEDKMFIYNLNEHDLMTINFILAAFSFKYSVYDTIEARFFNDFSSGVSGILRYEFKTPYNFYDSHKNMFLTDYVNDITDTEYLDLNLAALIAKNNGLTLRVYLDEEDENKVFADLIFGDKIPELGSPSLTEYQNYITLEEIKERAEIELSCITGN